MRTGTQRFRKTVVARALITAFCGTATMMIAQETLAQQSSSSLQRVEITGSNIKRTDTETASPVQVLTREDIERTGKQSIQEVLRGVTADGLGSIPTSFSNGFAAGSAAVSLRGLGVNSTLVLVNGRRMTTYGLADDGIRNFVDLNSLPLEAVDRIEILKDGASAIYGADAVGGVVNVILRKNYTGKSIGGSYGQTGHHDGQTKRVFGSAGFGNIDENKWNAFFTLEASKQDNIWSKDRGFIGQSDLSANNFYDTTLGAPRYWLGATSPTINTPWGTTRALPLPGSGTRVNVVKCDPSLVDPVTHVCRYNSLVEQEVQPRIDRLNFFGRGTMEFSPAMTGYAELGIFNTLTRANGTLGANNDSGVYNPSDPLNPVFTHNPMVLPAGHPDNTFGVDRLVAVRPNELGGRDDKLDNTVMRLVTGLQGSALGWDYDTAIGYIHSSLKETRTGYINYDVMQAALNNGTYRFSGLGPNRTDPAVLAAISPPLANKPTSSVTFADFKANREMMNLPGGPLGVAFGAEVRREEANTPAVPGTETSSIVGLGYSAFNSSRTVSALFGEVVAPVTKIIELNGAVRVDHYSDFGNSTTPKLGFKLKPMDGFAVRGTYAEAFRAPGPAEVGGSSFGFTNVAILTIGNPNIKPEKAKSYTLGFIAEPWTGTSATVDFWKIDRKNEIIQADPATIAGPGLDTGTPNSRAAGSVPNSFVYYDSDGNLSAVSGLFANASRTKTDGVDVELRHRMNLGSMGKLTAQLNWSHTRSLQRTDQFGTTFEYAGTHGPIVQSSGAGSPKDRVSFSLSLDKGPWTVTGMVNYVGPIKLVDHKGEQAVDNGDGTVTDAANGLVWNWDGTSSLGCGAFSVTGQPYNGCKLPSFTTFDLYAKWTPVKNLDINFSVQNLFARKAPLDPYMPLTYGINYNQGWHQAGALGRYFTIGAKYTF
jgi:iron complex outermembrane receptor protein